MAAKTNTEIVTAEAAPETVAAELVETDFLAGLREEIQDLANAKPSMFNSLSGADFETRIKTAEALTTSEPVANNIGSVINLRHIIIQAVQFVNEQTGKPELAPRVVLIDDDGRALHATSNGIYLAAKTFLGTLGHPSSWPSAVPIVIKREGSGTRQYFTFEVAR